LSNAVVVVGRPGVSKIAGEAFGIALGIAFFAA
jgi:hypothetical protein